MRRVSLRRRRSKEMLSAPVERPRRSTDAADVLAHAALVAVMVSEFECTASPGSIVAEELPSIIEGKKPPFSGPRLSLIVTIPPFLKEMNVLRMPKSNVPTLYNKAEFMSR